MVSVVTPPAFALEKDENHLILWLHGNGQDNSYLNRKLKPVLEKFWAKNALSSLIVAVPSARRSFYMDYKDGSEEWETFIMEELIPHLRQKYRLKAEAKTLIGGYSMGGMGSLRMAFKYPEKFGAIAAIAPAIEPAYKFVKIKSMDREHRSVEVYEEKFGQPFDHKYWRKNHPPSIAKQNADFIKSSGLRIYFEVGGDDEFGLDRGAYFLHRTLLKNEVSHEYRRVLAAGHSDGTLNARLADAFAFLKRIGY
tara:strand:+ start:634 stop:1389 length:756 start_codon:yes stop_codon:yes gene_type:complete